MPDRKTRRYDGRAIPSFFILEWSVVRFIPSLAAAPAGKPITHLVTRRIQYVIVLTCSRGALEFFKRPGAGFIQPVTHTDSVLISR